MSHTWTVIILSQLWLLRRGDTGCREKLHESKDILPTKKATTFCLANFDTAFFTLFSIEEEIEVEITCCSNALL